MKIKYDGDKLINVVVPNLEKIKNRLYANNVQYWKSFVEWDFYYKRELDEVYDSYPYNYERIATLISKIKEKDEKYNKIDMTAKNALLYNSINEIERIKKRI